MKSSHLVFLSVYVTCIILGFGVGKALKKSETVESEPPSVFTLPQSIPTLKNGQHNLLVIIVNDLEVPQQQLKSVWLVTYFIDNQSVTFFPISPTYSNGAIVSDQLLFDSFKSQQIDGRTHISPSFFDILTMRNFWWSGYLVVDQEAITSLLEGASHTPEIPFVDLRDIPTIDASVDDQDPDVIYQKYTVQLQAICDLIAQQGENFNWAKFINLLPRHIDSDLDAGLMIDEWVSSFDSIETANCYFPLHEQTNDAAEQESSK